MSEPSELFNSRRSYRIERLRKGQQEAALTIERCVVGGKQFVSIVLPTRYGKTHVIRATAGQLIHQGFACCALVLSPATFLRNQFTNGDKVKGFVDLLEPTFDLTGKLYTIKQLVENPGANGEWFLSANIHQIQRNLDIYGKWVESMVTRHNKTLLVYIDEAHTGSVKNAWGEVARVLSRHGATIILLTATPYRTDGDSIFGFRTITISEEEYRKIVPSQASRPDYVKLTVFEGCKRVVRLDADYEYPLKDAWEEDPLPIARVEWLPFAVNVTELTGGEKTLLSELKPGEVRGLLGRVTRDPLVIRSGIELQVEKLRELKRKDSTIAAIVFCGNDRDDDDEDNAHVKSVAAMYKMIAPDLRVLVSTCASDDDDDLAMERFARGEGDVIIVKQRGSIGLDIERLKIALDLSSVRTRSAFYQRMMRIATIYKGFWGIFICPDEPIGSAHFETIIGENGGEMTVARMEKVSETEVPRKDQPEKKFYSVDGVEDADFADSNENWADKKLLGQVAAFRQVFPEIIGLMSHAEIAVRIDESHLELRVPPPKAPGDYDTDLRIYTIRKTIVGKMSEIVKRDRKCRAVEREGDEPYGMTSQHWYKRLYQAAQITYVPIHKQNKLDILIKLDITATAMLADIYRKDFGDES